MKKELAPIVPVLVFLLALTASAQSEFTEITFRDEFDGPAGSAVDSAKWTNETGGWGWGNQELQFYTEGSANAFLDGKGRLVIRAAKADRPEMLKCWYGPCRFESGKLVSKGKFEQKYGRFEARIKLPRGQGIWPAFWLLGNDIDTVGWPKCGEIDVMENIGREPRILHGTIHGPGYSGDKAIGGKSESKRDLADGFHVYSAVWTENEIRFFFDGKQYFRVTPRDLPEGAKWVYDHPFYMLINLAVGGAWPGEPDQTTKFPQTMLVDYVRVYGPRPGIR
jgi:beta-glucanase (GH16 family)